MLMSRLAQANGQVNETGGNDKPARVDGAAGMEIGVRSADRDDAAGCDGDVAGRVMAAGGVNDSTVLDEDASSGGVAGNDGHHGHADGNAEGHLRQDHAVPPVGHRRADLDATVDRSRMHNDRIRLGVVELGLA